MATGIVAIAAKLEGMFVLAEALTWFNGIAYVFLWVLTIFRLAAFPQFFWNDLIDHTRGMGFFTMVAGTAVLGSEAISVYGRFDLALALWFLACTLWVLLMYLIFTAFTVKEQKPSLGDGINGGWLLAIVATQTVSVFSTMLAPDFGPHDQGILFLALAFWLCGGMLYIWMVSLILYRLTFFRFSPSDLLPQYWIDMGAVASSTLAGTLLAEKASKAHFLESLHPFLVGFSIFFWATATWWIPMLVTLGFWRHVYKRYHVSYNPVYWAPSFPWACTRPARITFQK
jgi:tellurite resistance protein TehA-like permease